MLNVTSEGITPTPLEELAWGSASISSTFLSKIARLAAKLIAVVVLPTPPFWLAIATIFPMFTRVFFGYLKIKPEYYAKITIIKQRKNIVQPQY
jgi:hypothetical protein